MTMKRTIRGKSCLGRGRVSSPITTNANKPQKRTKKKRKCGRSDAGDQLRASECKRPCMCKRIPPLCLTRSMSGQPWCLPVVVWRKEKKKIRSNRAKDGGEMEGGRARSREREKRRKEEEKRMKRLKGRQCTRENKEAEPRKRVLGTNEEGTRCNTDCTLRRKEGKRAQEETLDDAGRSETKEISCGRSLSKSKSTPGRLW